MERSATTSRSGDLETLDSLGLEHPRNLTEITEFLGEMTFHGWEHRELADAVAGLFEVLENGLRRMSLPFVPRIFCQFVTDG